jgi:hypothetical protein
MFVLMSLILSCLQRARELFFGAYQPLALIQCAQCTTEIVAHYLSSLIAPLHAPIPKLTV